MTTTDGLPGGTRVGRTALRVADLEGTTRFYRRVVGLEVLSREGSTATLGVDGAPLLVLTGDADAPGRGSAEAGLYHSAFRVPSRAALGDALRRVRQRWRLDGASDHGVSEALYLTDPEDNGVEIYRDYPREAWPVDDGAVRMGSAPLEFAALEAAARGDDRAPAGTDVGHVHLEVASLEAFEAFYVEALGMEMRATAPGARFVAAGGYHHHVGANTWNGRTAPAGRTRGLEWFELVVPGADALESVRARLSGRDVQTDGTDQGFEVVDPDGLRVRLRAES